MFLDSILGLPSQLLGTVDHFLTGINTTANSTVNTIGTVGNTAITGSQQILSQGLSSVGNILGNPFLMLGVGAVVLLIIIKSP